MILFVNFEGVRGTIFRTQVLSSAIKAKKAGYDVKIIAFEPLSRNMQESINRAREYEKISGVGITVTRCLHPNIPIASMINTIVVTLYILASGLWRNSISHIMAREDRCAHSCILLSSLLRSRLIWDCRGDSLDELIFWSGRRWDKLFSIPYELYARVSMRIIVELLSICAWRYVFVSESLASSYERKLCFYRRDRSNVIPCQVDTNVFRFDACTRHKMRRNHGFDQSDLVGIYSGSVEAYQGIEKLIQWVDGFLKKDTKRHFVFAVPDFDRVQSLLSELGVNPEQYTLRWLEQDELRNFLLMADFGMLIRENTPLNKVASPTKAGEYFCLGLVVVGNDVVDQVRAYGTKLSLYAHYADFPDKYFFSEVSRSERATEAQKLYQQPDFPRCLFVD